MSKKKTAKNKAPSVVRSWKKFFGLSCTHADHINRRAWDKALAIKKDLDPDFTFHLGDFLDTTAFMSGMAGSGREQESPKADLECGLFHLQTMEPDLVLCGNHEDRLWRHLESKSYIVAEYAHDIIGKVQAACKGMGSELVPYSGQFQGVMMGPALLTHGTIFNVNAARDMAETYGSNEVRFVIFGHTHTVAIGMARAAHGCMGINVGALTDRRAMEYAKNRRQTWAWVNACITGEYCDNDMVYQLHVLDQEKAIFNQAEAA